MSLNYKIINRKKRIVVKITDLLGYTLFYPLVLFKRWIGKKQGIKRDRVGNILVVRLAYIGDVIMTIPVLRSLKALYPNAKISFLIGRRESEVLQGNPYIDQIITYDAFWFYKRRRGVWIREYLTVIKRLRRGQFDIAIDFRGDIRNILFILFLSRAHFRISYGVGGGGYLLTHIVPFKGIGHKIAYHMDILRYLGGDYKASLPEISLSDDERAYQNRLFDRLGIPRGTFVVGIHPGGRKPLKGWYIEGYIGIIERLIREYSAQVVLTGTGGEIALCDKITKGIKDERVISMCGRTGLRELVSLIRGFDLFITGDSAPMHIACAVKTPVIAIFGPSKSKETGPYGRASYVVEKDFPCRLTCDEDKCNHKVYNACMKAIGVEDVYKAINIMLK